MTSNAVKYRDTKNKERELDMKAKAQQHELDYLDQQRATSAADEKYKKRKTETAGWEAAGSALSGAGKALGGVAALANDFSFYTKTGEGMTNLLKVSTTDQAGRTKNIPDVLVNATAEVSDDVDPEVVDLKASIYAYDFVPSIGHDLGQMSSTAIAIRKFNTRVRGDNSGSTNYDSVDLFMYPLATDSLAYFLAWLERGLDLVNHVESRDLATLNNRLLLAHCWGRQSLANTFVREPSAILNLMNRAIESLDALQIPFEIDYIKRHTWLCKKVFTYGEGVSRRYIIFRPSIYRVYDEASGSLKAYSLKNRFLHEIANATTDVYLSDIESILTEMIGPLANSQATATMSGDIAKAFGYEGIKFQKYPLDYTARTEVSYETDEKYLMSIRNAIITPLASTSLGAATWHDELEDLSIRQVVNSDLNPVLFMGNIYETGDAQITSGPKVNDSGSFTYIFVHESDDGDYPDIAKLKFDRLPDSILNYVDYRSNTPTEEDQLYNYSFRHDYKQGRDKTGADIVTVDHCRSEIIVGAQTYTTNPRDVSNWNVTDFSTIMENGQYNDELVLEDVVDSVGSYLYQLHKLHSIIGSEKYGPMIILNFVLQGYYTPENDAEYIGSQDIFMIWDRHFNRKFNTPELLEQINYEALVNLFIQGNSRSNRRPRGKNNR